MKTEIEIDRWWEMPTRWTFAMKAVQDLLNDYLGAESLYGVGWVDPFAGINSPAEMTNDIEEDHPTTHHMDGLEFLKTLPDASVVGTLFDPPYSTEQALRRYTPKHGGTAGRAEYWARCKDEIARIVKPGGWAISFGWDSTGIGGKRGFRLQRIRVICHGALHNDTLITVEQKETDL